MKAKVIYSDDEVSIFMEDGGHAYVWENGDGIKTQYYQSRIPNLNFEECETVDVDFTECEEGKSYIKDWPEGTKMEDEEVRLDAIHWLCMPNPDLEIIVINN